MGFSSHIMKGLKGDFKSFQPLVFMSLSQNVVVGFMQKAILSKIYAIYVEH